MTFNFSSIAGLVYWYHRNDITPGTRNRSRSSVEAPTVDVDGGVMVTTNQELSKGNCEGQGRSNGWTDGGVVDRVCWTTFS